MYVSGLTKNLEYDNFFFGKKYKSYSSLKNYKCFFEGLASKLSSPVVLLAPLKLTLNNQKIKIIKNTI